LDFRGRVMGSVKSPCKGKGKGLDTCYSATYMSQTRDQQRFTISEVAADYISQWCRSAMWPSIPRERRLNKHVSSVRKSAYYSIKAFRHIRPLLTRDIARAVAALLRRRSRQRERLDASVLSMCSSVCLSVCLSVVKMQKTRFFQS